MNNMIQKTKEYGRKKDINKMKNTVVQHSVNIKTYRGRQYLQFYFWRGAFISRSAFDANTLHNRLSDAE